MLVGGGGREHAMAEALCRWGAELAALMPNRNPGIERLAAVVRRAAVTDVDAARSLAESWGAELLVVGPEAALAAGVTDEVAALGVRVASPSQMAARVETSKAFMRDLMRRHGVGGPVEWAAFSDPSEARDHLLAVDYPVAVKPAGLTGGKGVKVEGKDFRAGDREAAARLAAEAIASGAGNSARVVIERALEGEEFTLMAFCDGQAVAPMPLVQDHKRAFEGDKGPNTGGMGSYSLADHSLPFLSPEERASAEEILRETVAGLRADGCPFVGVLYGQFMATVDGPRVIEFNARFGDPEAMNVLPLLETNYVDVCAAMADGALKDLDVRFQAKATVCKYVVPRGYGSPGVAAGAALRVDEPAVTRAGARLYYAAVDAEAEGGVLRTTSSRALAVVGVADRLGEAERAAEAALAAVEGEYDVRHDIGTPLLVARRVERMKGLRIKQARRGGA
ncbi:MAG TPA: phosphoribosylamine--glycine ligase [Candidatus Thermoplasmatota archaeon]